MQRNNLFLTLNSPGSGTSVTQTWQWYQQEQRQEGAEDAKSVISDEWKRAITTMLTVNFFFIKVQIGSDADGGGGRNLRY